MILYYISLSCFTTDCKHLHYQWHDKLLLLNQVILRHITTSEGVHFSLKTNQFQKSQAAQPYIRTLFKQCHIPCHAPASATT